MFRDLGRLIGILLIASCSTDNNSQRSSAASQGEAEELQSELWSPINYDRLPRVTKGIYKVLDRYGAQLHNVDVKTLFLHFHKVQVIQDLTCVGQSNCSAPTKPGDIMYIRTRTSVDFNSNTGLFREFQDKYVDDESWYTGGYAYFETRTAYPFFTNAEDPKFREVYHGVRFLRRDTHFADVNGDGVVSPADCDRVEQFVRTGVPPTGNGKKINANQYFDVDGDRQISSRDVDMCRNYLGEKVHSKRTQDLRRPDESHLGDNLLSNSLCFAGHSLLVDLKSGVLPPSSSKVKRELNLGTLKVPTESNVQAAILWDKENDKQMCSWCRHGRNINKWTDWNVSRWNSRCYLSQSGEWKLDVTVWGPDQRANGSSERTTPPMRFQGIGEQVKEGGKYKVRWKGTVSVYGPRKTHSFGTSHAPFHLDDRDEIPAGSWSTEFQESALPLPVPKELKAAPQTIALTANERGSWSDSNLQAEGKPSRLCTGADCRALWIHNGLSNGLYEVEIFHLSAYNSTKMATLKIDGYQPNAAIHRTVTIDQQKGKAGWMSIGFVPVTNRSVRATLVGDGQGYLRSGGMRLRKWDTMPTIFTFDISSPEYIENFGHWYDSSLPTPSGTPSRYASFESMANSEWRFYLPKGDYEIYYHVIGHPTTGEIYLSLDNGETTRSSRRLNEWGEDLPSRWVRTTNFTVGDKPLIIEPSKIGGYYRNSSVQFRKVR